MREVYGTDRLSETSGQELSNLEQRITRLENIEADRRAAAEMRAEQRRQQMQQIAAAASAIMLNPSADDQAKVQAWGQIRMNAADAWTDEIVAEAVRIGTTSTDPQIRANVWRQAHAGQTHPLLLQPLLNALANELERSAREEAAETLDLYLDEPGVREALQIASQYDADPGVRRQAMTSLAGPQGGF